MEYCIVHIGNTNYRLDQDVKIGDKLFLPGRDKPVKVCRGYWYKNVEHFDGVETK